MENQPNNVIGPFKSEDWMAMIELQGQIKYFKATGQNPQGMKDDQDCLNYFKNKYIARNR